MGDAAAITDSNFKTIEIGNKSGNFCTLVKNVRHELEHALQHQRLQECKAQGLKHSFADHIIRERSAYLNDYATLPQYCFITDHLEFLKDFTLDYAIKHY